MVGYFILTLTFVSYILARIVELHRLLLLIYMKICHHFSYICYQICFIGHIAVEVADSDDNFDKSLPDQPHRKPFMDHLESYFLNIVYFESCEVSYKIQMPWLLQFMKYQRPSSVHYLRPCLFIYANFVHYLRPYVHYLRPCP